MLGAWAVIGTRGEGPPASPTRDQRPAVAGDGEARRLLDQFEWLGRDAADSQSELFSLEKKRRTIDEARMALEAARDRLAADHAARKKKLDELDRAVHGAEQRVQAEWGRLLAQSAHQRERLLEELTVQLPISDKTGPKRFVILDRTPFPKPVAPEGRDNGRSSESAANLDRDAFALARLATVYQIPEPTAIAPSTEQRLDGIIEQLQSLDARVKSLGSDCRSFSFDCSAIVAAEPPWHFDPTKPTPSAGVFGYSRSAITSPVNSKMDLKPSIEQKLQTIVDSLDGLSRRLSDFERQRQQAERRARAK
jgi:hypothetical protein